MENVIHLGGKDLPCVDKVPFFLLISYLELLDEVSSVMDAQPSKISIGYKFSTWQNSNPVANHRNPQLPLELFREALLHAWATVKGTCNNKPFHVILFVLQAQTNNSNSKLTHAKAGKAFFIIIIIYMSVYNKC